MAKAAADRSEFEALIKRVDKCIVDRHLGQLADQDRVNFDIFAADYPVPLVVEWFQKKGVTVANESVRKHLRGECCCARGH